MVSTLQETINTCFVEIFNHPDILDYLHSRGITDEMIINYKLGYGSFYGVNWIVIPVFDVSGEPLFTKLRRDPKVGEDVEPSKYKFYPMGSDATIYGWSSLLCTNMIVVVEGEFDRMIMESKGIPAITSTGGAMTFKKEWLIVFKDIQKIYICFDSDEPGRKGAKRLAHMIAEQYSEKEINIISLPETVGEHGDITDYFIKVKGDLDDLFYKYSERFTYKAPLAQEKRTYNYSVGDGPLTQEQIDAASAADCKNFVEIVRESGGLAWARCPFGGHEDKTPSLCCYPGEKGWYSYCCGEGGNAIVLIEKLFKLSFVESVKYILSVSGR